MPRHPWTWPTDISASRWQKGRQIAPPLDPNLAIALAEVNQDRVDHGARSRAWFRERHTYRVTGVRQGSSLSRIVAGDNSHEADN